MRNIDHPDFEVHTWHSLGRAVNRHPTGLERNFRKGLLKLLAFRHDPMHNVLAISREEIAKLKDPYAFGRTRVNSPLRAKALEMRAAGVPVTKIAVDLDVHKTTVYYWINNAT
jgi:hypothetical protein